MQNLEVRGFVKRERFQAAADTQVHLRPLGARLVDNGVQGDASVSHDSETMASDLIPPRVIRSELLESLMFLFLHLRFLSNRSPY